MKQKNPYFSSNSALNSINVRIAPAYTYLGRIIIFYKDDISELVDYTSHTSGDGW